MSSFLACLVDAFLLSISSLTVKDVEVQITVGASSLQRKTSTAVSSYSSPSLSNYTRTSKCEDLFAFYSTLNDCINNYFLTVQIIRASTVVNSHSVTYA